LHGWRYLSDSGRRQAGRNDGTALRLGRPVTRLASNLSQFDRGRRNRSGDGAEVAVNFAGTCTQREETAVQWSLDHLFLDQNAVPTLVDVRRTPNAELRQKVLGQSIDYAANALFTGRSIQLLLCLKLIVAIGVAIPNRFLKSFSVQMLMKRDFGRRLKLICKPVKFA